MRRRLLYTEPPLLALNGQKRGEGYWKGNKPAREKLGTIDKSKMGRRLESGAAGRKQKRNQTTKKLEKTLIVASPPL